MRITDSGLTQTYLRNLQRSQSDLAASNLKLTSQRKYNHVSEDTGSAARAFAVRDQLAKNQEYTNTVDNAIGELDTADDNILTISSILKNVYARVTKAAGGSMSQENLDAIAEELDGLNNEILQTMNAKYGDKYLFSGSGNDVQPFTVDEDGKLLFNGVDVDQATAETDFKENKVVYLDIGFGMTADPDGINRQTGIKISTSGIDVIGFGKDADGEPKNLYSLISKIGGQLKEGDLEGARDSLERLQKAEDGVSSATAELGTRQSILDRAKDRMEAETINLKARQKSLEGVSLEEEAMNNKSYEMAWMVTLQLGSSIIPPSIFDFMR